LRTPVRDVVKAFDAEPLQRELIATWVPRYNIAPTQEVAVVRYDLERARRTLGALHWGLVPSWADDPTIGNRMINARSETAATKPAFREAFRRRRCLVAADGFFEWKRGTRPKQPYYFRLEEDRPFALAGLWERWRRGELSIESCTILTTTANELVEELHDRMPVILDQADYDAWLDPRQEDVARLARLLVPYPAERMMAYPVNTVVNSARLDAPECVAPASTGKVQGTLFE
jgi:putative SOS response-associated peptidase YedK